MSYYAQVPEASARTRQGVQAPSSTPFSAAPVYSTIYPLSGMTRPSYVSLPTTTPPAPAPSPGMGDHQGQSAIYSPANSIPPMIPRNGGTFQQSLSSIFAQDSTIPFPSSNNNDTSHLVRVAPNPIQFAFPTQSASPMSAVGHFQAQDGVGQEMFGVMESLQGSVSVPAMESQPDVAFGSASEVCLERGQWDTTTPFQSFPLLQPIQPIQPEPPSCPQETPDPFFCDILAGLQPREFGSVPWENNTTDVMFDTTPCAEGAGCRNAQLEHRSTSYEHCYQERRRCNRNGNEMYYCTLCGQWILVRRRKHHTKKHQDGLYVCRICYILGVQCKPLSRKDALKRHISTRHPEFLALLRIFKLRILEPVRNNEFEDLTELWRAMFPPGSHRRAPA